MSRYTASSATSICNVLYSFYNHHVHTDRTVRAGVYHMERENLRAYARKIAVGTRNGEREGEREEEREKDKEKERKRDRKE